MVINKDRIAIKVQYTTVKYWTSKGYKCSVCETIYVPLEEVQPKSNIMIDCICDMCKRTYSQRRSRDLSVCGYCKTKTRMSGNNFGSSNTKYDLPSKEELKRLIEQQYGKDHLAKHYKVSIPVISGWLKKLQIDIRPYHGRRFFSSDEKYQDAVEQVRQNLSEDSIMSISTKTNIPRHIIVDISKREGLDLPNKFKNWDSALKDITSNMKHYVKENKKKTLKKIADDENISVEQLKRAFKETGTQVRDHSYNKSAGELEVRDFIRSLGENCFSYRFDKTFEIDCYVPTKGFGVEYCGEYWHRYVSSKQNKYYHRDKHEYFENKDINIVTIFECEWKNNKELIKSMIMSRLGYSNRIYGRKCRIDQIDRKKAEDFHKKNHINKSTNSSINIGLFHKEELVSVLSLIKSRFDKNFEYEIARYSTLQSHTIVGGFSKMFSFFTKNYNPQSCMTYADLRFGQGKVYSKSGFDYLGKTIPNYFYYDKTSCHLENRMKYQKSKLKNLVGYDANKTEFEIMNDSGYYRLYDCGNKKYGWSS